MNLKFFKKKKKFRKGGSGVKPNLYWKYILYVTFFLIIGSFVFGFYFFMKTNEQLTLPTIKTSKKETIKKERLNDVLKYFTEREKKSTEILNTPSPIIDPSL